jgi:hypothetical protein
MAAKAASLTASFSPNLRDRSDTGRAFVVVLLPLILFQHES